MIQVNPRGSKHDRIGDELATTTRYGQLQEFDVENESIYHRLPRAGRTLFSSKRRRGRVTGSCFTQQHWNQNVRAATEPRCP